MGRGRFAQQQRQHGRRGVCGEATQGFAPVNIRWCRIVVGRLADRPSDAYYRQSCCPLQTTPKTITWSAGRGKRMAANFAKLPELLKGN